LITKGLAWKPMVGIGLISYSLYLVHWPIAVFTRYWVLAPLQTPQIIFIIAASFVLAILSWRFIERPFRGARLTWSRARVLVTALAALIAVAAVGVGGVAAHGFPARFKGYDPARSDPAVGWREGACFYEGGDAFRTWSADACKLTNGPGEAVLLWGDSFAAHYASGIVAHADRIPYRIYEYAFASCPPALTYFSYARPSCGAFNRHALEIVRELHVKRVILSGRWLDLQSRGLDQLGSTLDALHAMGVQVDVVGQSPIFIIDTPLIAYRQRHVAGTVQSWPVSVSPTLNDRLRAQARGARFVDPIASLCIDGRCPYRINGNMLFTDSGHFTQFGSVQAVGRYMPVFGATLGTGAPKAQHNEPLE
jgi:hypothetical protein